MAPPGKPQLSLSEWLVLMTKLTTIVPLMLIFYLVRIVSFALRSRLPVRLYVLCAGIRTLFMSLSGREIQHLLPTTRQSYEAWIEQKAKRSRDPAHQQRLVRDVEPLESVDAAILWLGDRRKATKFVLFFHGGGFVVPAGLGHFEWCWNAYVKSGIEAGVEVAVGILQYSLWPGARFPTQVRQAAAALGALLDAGVRPADIVIGGDSAGGNLTVQLLGHLVQARDAAARRIDLAEPLAAAFAVSPWLSCNTTSRSFRENKNDMLSEAITEKLALGYLGDAELLRKAAAGSCAGAAPLGGDMAWLKGLDKVAPRVYVTVGKREVLADDGIGLVQTIKRLHPSSCDVRFEEADKEAHNFILMEAMAGQEGDATARMRDWFKSVITVS